MSDEKEQFRRELLSWFEQARRDLPWRRTTQPYAVWVSEIMLQQTRVAAAIPYYERFLARFPTVQALAEAPETDLLAHWAGLGYYYRARNLQKAAQLIQQAGSFPADYESIRALPGIGDYTAAAIASISFQLPYAVLDGNVFRVLSRVANDRTDISSTAGRKRFALLASQFLDREHPAAFNQAMMELGATLCLPKNPHCLMCPVSAMCAARLAGTQQTLPVKTKIQKQIEEERTVFWIERRGRILLWQRSADEKLMPGFWELPESVQMPNLVPQHELGVFRHSITFHNYKFQVVAAEAPKRLSPCKWISIDKLETLPVSTVVKKALRLRKESLRSVSIRTITP